MIVAVAVPAPAFAVSSAAAYVSASSVGQYTVPGLNPFLNADGNGVVTDPKSASYIMPDEQHGGVDFVTLAGSAAASLKNRKLGVDGFAAANVTYPSDGLLPQQYVNTVASVTDEAFLYDLVTFVPTDRSLIGQPFDIETGWHLKGSLFATANVGTSVAPPNTFVPYGMQDDAGATLTVSGTGVKLTGPADQFVEGYNGYDNDHSTTIVAKYDDVPVEIAGTWGVRMPIQYQLTLLLEADASTNDLYLQQGANALTNADFSHTLLWGGISTITDAGGNPITSGWTVTSDSGTDWSQPGVEVPEPPSLLISVVAVILLSANRGQPRLRKALSSGFSLANGAVR
jgi:hypothetical protein